MEQQTNRRCSQPCQYVMDLNKDMIELAREYGKISHLTEENRRSISELYKDRNTMAKQNAKFEEQLKNIDEQLKQMKEDLKESMDGYSNKIEKLNSNMEDKLDEFKDMLSSNDKSSLKRFRNNMDSILIGGIVVTIVVFIVQAILKYTFGG